MANFKFYISAPLKLLLAILSLQFALCSSVHAVELTPPRLFFSDAKISFTFPDNWTLEPSFPYGPLFSRVTKEGAQAYISCQISDLLNADRVASDVPIDVLREFANKDVVSREPQARILAGAARSLAAHNAFEVTWNDSGNDVGNEYQSVYFFVENRIYALTLRARSDSFPWLVPDFQDWLGSVRVLTRRDAGSLDSPAHGGLWIHQTGGAKIQIPEEWLIAVADDHTLGAALAVDTMHSEITATVDVSSPTSQEISSDEKQEARQAIAKKGFTLLKESEEPFHGYPAYQIGYEGNKSGRFVRGQDIYVISPKARWLINLEGDAPFFTKLAGDYRSILNNIQFL